MMPHSRHFVGANSVTNIELNNGFLPAPIVRNAYWLENPRLRLDCLVPYTPSPEVLWLVPHNLCTMTRELP
ncbi:hypothetical protein ACVW0A_000310 [Pseudomonas sp. TE3610]